MMYVTVYNMSINSNCRILAAELNYRFTEDYHKNITDNDQEFNVQLSMSTNIDCMASLFNSFFK